MIINIHGFIKVLMDNLNYMILIILYCNINLYLEINFSILVQYIIINY